MTRVADLLVNRERQVTLPMHLNKGILTMLRVFITPDHKYIMFTIWHRPGTTTWTKDHFLLPAADIFQLNKLWNDLVQAKRTEFRVEGTTIFEAEDGYNRGKAFLDISRDKARQDHYVFRLLVEYAPDAPSEVKLDANAASVLQTRLKDLSQYCLNAFGGVD